jgi:hypothetical protein
MVEPTLRNFIKARSREVYSAMVQKPKPGFHKREIYRRRHF